MKNNNPAISVLMPVYNGERFLKEAIDSILSQTFTDFEFIIINDGSTDNTENIILSYKDERIVYIKNDVNLKLIKTLNKGVDLARGKYIARMDADDISLPTRLEVQYKFMERHPELAAISSWVNYISDKNKIIGKSTYYSCTSSIAILYASLFRTPLSHPSSFIKTNILRSIKYSDIPSALHIEDLVLWNTMLLQNYRLMNLKERLVNKRVDDNCITYKYKLSQAKNKIYFLQKQINAILSLDTELIKPLVLPQPLDYHTILKVQSFIYLIKRNFIKLYQKDLNSSDVRQINALTKDVLKSFLFQKAKLGSIKLKILISVRLIKLYIL